MRTLVAGLVTLFASAQAEANDVTLYSSLGGSYVAYDEAAGPDFDVVTAVELGLTYGFSRFWQLRLHANVLDDERVNRYLPVQESDAALRQATIALHVGGALPQSRLHLGVVVELGPERGRLWIARLVGEAAYEAGHGLMPFFAGHRIGVFKFEDLNGVESESTNNVGRWTEELGVWFERQRLIARESLRHESDKMAGHSHDLLGTQLSVAFKLNDPWAVYARADYARAEVDGSISSETDIAVGVIWGPAIAAALEQMTPASPFVDLTSNL